MEKPVRYISLISGSLTILFFISMFIGAGMGANNVTGTPYRIIATIANILLFVVPIVYMVVLTSGLMCFLKRTMFGRNTAIGQRNLSKEKFPTLFFVGASILFALFFIFVMAIMKTE